MKNETPPDLIDMAETIHELRMQAIVDFGQYQDAFDRIAELEAEICQLREVIVNPVAVHVNMLAGNIAKPSVENIIHIYGHKALSAALRETDGIPPDPSPPNTVAVSSL